MISVNQSLFDRGVRHAVFLERLKAGEVRQILALLNESWPDLLAQLTRRLERMSITGKIQGVKTTKRLRQMMEAIDQILFRGMDNAEKVLAQHLAQLAQAEARFQVQTLNGSLPSELGLSASVPNLRMLQGIVRSRPLEGKFLGEWFSGLKKATQAKLRSELNIGLAQGQTVQQLVARVRGVAPLTRRSAEMIVRTTSTDVATKARMLTFQENSDLVKEWRFVATLDLRTSIQCAELDGTTWPIGEGPLPPLHPNCRSGAIPVLASWRQLGLKGLPEGTRASMDGQVPARTTYMDWLKGRSAAEQDEVLGATRGLMFRKGQLGQGDLLTSTYSPISVEDLLRREGL